MGTSTLDTAGLITPEGLKIALTWVEATLTKTLADGRKHDRIAHHEDLDKLREIGSMDAEAFAGKLKKHLKRIANGNPIDLIELFQTPKAGGKERRAAYIPVFERVIALALVTSEYKKIWSTLYAGELGTQEGMIDYCRPLPVAPLQPKLISAAERKSGKVEDAKPDVSWLTAYGASFGKFRERTEELINSGNHTVHILDVSDFSGSVQYEHLCAGLEQMGLDPARIQALSAILDSWKKQGVQGLPQESILTDVLMKLYMHQVDVEMQALCKKTPGLEYFRYHDDFRIASANPQDADRARDVLQQRLDAIGLRFNADKTDRVSPGEQPKSANETMAALLGPVWQGYCMKSGASGPLPSAKDMPAPMWLATYNTLISPSRANKAYQAPQAVFNYVLKNLHACGAIPPDDLKGILGGSTERLPQVLLYLGNLHFGTEKTQKHDIMPHLKVIKSMLLEPDTSMNVNAYNRLVFGKFLDSVSHTLPAARALMDGLQMPDGQGPKIIRRALKHATHQPAAVH
ncbi:MAG: hypothetical protein EBQ96_03950 [Proteobacteria bacterium]|nr:hypothetical protein [Pseudomonadota bacterium]